MRSPPESNGSGTLVLDGRRPVLAAVVDLSEPLPTLTRQGRYDVARCLIVLQGAPLGWCEVSLDDPEVLPTELAEIVWSRMGPAISAALAARGGGAPVALPVEGFDLGPAPAARVEPDAAVVIATRERPEQLEACLRSVFDGVALPGQVVVVDNAPTTDGTERLVTRLAEVHPELVYVREDRPGLGRAHNAALPHLSARHVAFTDDDVVVHRWWLANILAAFGAAPDVRCVTGMIAPLELDTATQQIIESHSGFNKGFQRRVFDARWRNGESILFPFAAGLFGSGANMAFETHYLRSVGGFDDALGAGTVALGGDDLAAFYDVIVKGHQLVYEPAAIVSHRHHREFAALERQAYGYGAGLSAYLTRCIIEDPSTAISMLRAARPALRRAVRIVRPPALPTAPAPPRSLARRHLKGMAAGPVLYLKSRRAERVSQPATSR